MKDQDLRDTSKLNKFQKFFYGYGCYHSDLLNVLVHIICVPPITFTLGKILEYYSTKLPVNPFYLIFLIWGPIYLYVDPILGTLTTIQYLLTDYLTIGMDFGFMGYSSIQVMVALHILSWLAQFFAHGVFEKRKPALMDNLLLMFSAPVFVNIEIFYFLFGYRNDEIKETKKYIDFNIKEFRAGLKRN